MNKIILIIYVGVKKYPKDRLNDILSNIAENLSAANEEVYHYVFPDFDSTSFKVECVNPKFISQEEYKEIEAKLEEVKLNLQKTLNKLNEV